MDVAEALKEDTQAVTKRFKEDLILSIQGQAMAKIKTETLLTNAGKVFFIKKCKNSDFATGYLIVADDAELRFAYLEDKIGSTDMDA